MTLPKFFQNPETAYLAWSYLAEGSDAAARQVVEKYGPVGALEWLETTTSAVAEKWIPRWKKCQLPQILEGHLWQGRSVLTPAHPKWPKQLRHLGDTEPFALWIRGNQQVVSNAQGSVAIVGARASSHAGDRLAAELAIGMCEHHRTVVSGGAFGIDCAAARGALQAGGSTIAVMAGGVDNLYPTSNVALLQEVCQSGAVISESPPGARPTRWRFLDRNRIIAALSAVTVIVEAASRSGALNTANHALQLGREVCAVPGFPYSAMSQGCNQLIREGATLVTSASEVLELLEPFQMTLPAAPRPPETPDLGSVEKRVYDALPVSSGATFDSLCRASGLDSKTLQVTLGSLSIKGLVQRELGKWARKGPQK